MPDEGQLETGNRLFPLFVGIVAAEHLDDVFNGDVAKLAFLPGKEKAHGVHLFVFGNTVGDMALGANCGAHFLARELVRIDPDRIESLHEGKTPGKPERHVPVVMTIYAGHAQRPVFFGDLEEDRKSTRLNSSHITISYA